MKEKWQKILEKLKTNKKLQIMLLGLVVCVILLVYLAYFVIGTNEEGVESISTENSSTGEYVSYLEDKLENVISNIEGVGKVNVAITISSGFVYEYAYEDKPSAQ